MSGEYADPTRVMAAKIAPVCHAANRALCASVGDHSQPAWEDAPQWQVSSAIEGVQAVLDDPEIQPGALHERWRDSKRADGWVYGPVKDAGRKVHPCMLPFAFLPVHDQEKDRLFIAVVRALSAG